MNFENLIFEELRSGTLEHTRLDEGFLPLNSILAYYTLKRNALSKLKNLGGISSKKESIKSKARDFKAKALISKEQARAGAESTSKDENDASYKLTKKQLEVLSKIHEKYGNEIIQEVLKFRKNILAPYQVIKKLIRNNKTITSKDKFGMTHSQYLAAVTSGLKKIEKRGTFLETDKELQETIDDLIKSIDALNELKKIFISTGNLKEGIVNRVLKYYKLGPDDFDESLDDLRKTYDELKANNKLVTNIKDNPEELDPATAQSIIRRNIELRKGAIKTERENLLNVSESVLEEEFNFNVLMNKNKFNVALGKYMLRRAIINDLKMSGANIYKKTYSMIIDKLLEKAIERKKEVIDKKVKLRSNINFNETERKIFKIRPDIKTEFSSKPSDYSRAVVDDDFTNTDYVKKPEGLVKAENDIEAEIKRFERFLQSKMDAEDFSELKKYRLINNLITVKELSDPDKLFKTPEELAKMKSKEKRETPEEPEETQDDEVDLDLDDLKNIDDIEV